MASILKGNTMIWQPVAWWVITVNNAPPSGGDWTQNSKRQTPQYTTFTFHVTTKIWVLSSNWPRVEAGSNLKVACRVRTNWACYNSSTKQTCMPICMLTAKSLKIATNWSLRGTKKILSRVCRFINSWLRRNWGFGSHLGIMMLMCRWLELSPGFKCSGKRPLCLSKTHGGNGG